MRRGGGRTTRRRARGAAALLLAVGLWLLLPGAARAADVVTDGDMEAAGIAAWPHTDVLGTNASAKATDQSAAGQSLKGTSQAGSRVDVEWYNAQTVGTVDAADTVTLSLWWGARFNVTTTNAQGTIAFEARPAGGNWTTLWTQDLATNTTSFQGGTVSGLDVSASFDVTESYDVRVFVTGRTGRNPSATLEVWWDDVVLDVTGAGNTAPSATITAPADGSSFPSGSDVTFTGAASDAEDGDLTAGLSWTSSLDGAIGTGGSFTTGALSAGTHTVTASVTDSGGLPGTDQISVTITAAGNTAPSVTITAPADGSSFPSGSDVTFTGAASDAEDGDLTAGLSWTSSLDGAIGTGGSFTTGTLSAGTHTVTASVTDSGGLQGSDQITVTMTTGGSEPGTAAGASSAFVSSCRQLTVLALFSGDSDGDGSAQVQFNTADSFPAQVACATLTGPSPRQCLVTGLSPSTAYWLQVDFTDPDGVTGTDPQVLGPFTTTACGGDEAAPTVLVLTPRRDAVVGGVERVKVQVYDEGGLAAADPVRWSVDGGALSAAVSVNANYDCGTGCAVYELDLDTTGLANGEHYLTVEARDAAGNLARVGQGVRVNNVGTRAAGGGLLLRRSHGSQLCMDCHALPTHSSQATSTKYGNWAQACLDCHTPHRTSNVFLIRSQIRTPSSGSRTVRFEDHTLGAQSDSTTPGTASFVNEDNTSGQADGPCQACHTRTGGATPRWRNAAAGGNQATHYVSPSTQPCVNCHPHDAGFSPGGSSCLDCHSSGGPAVDAGRRPVEVDFTRQSHHVGDGGVMGGLLTKFDCVVCHAEGRLNATADDVETTEFHNDAACNGATEPCIDLKSADDTAVVFSYDKAAVAASAGAAPGWNSSNAVWRTQTSTALDPFCLTCHDADGAVASFNANDGGSAGNPFGDAAITNAYDQVDRGAVVDIRSRVTATADLDGDGIADPPEGIYSRHAVRGQAASRYTAYQNIGGAADFSIWEGDPTAGTSLLTSMGSDEGGKPLWNDTSVMGCADCHTVDGANGAAGNAHGSPSEYLLKDAFGKANEGSLTNYDATAQTGGYVCWRCHQRGRYVDPGSDTLGDHTGNSNEWQDTTAVTGLNRLDDGKGNNVFAIACLNCHGGFGFGAIHGTSDVFGVGRDGGSGTRNAYRFMNGASLRFYDPAGWTGTAITCYTLGSADAWGGCTQHDRGQGWTKPLQRPISY